MRDVEGRDTAAQRENNNVAQHGNDTTARRENDTAAQRANDPVAQRGNDTVAQQETVVAQPVPVEEAGLETGRGTAGDPGADGYQARTAQDPAQAPAQESAQESVRDTVRDRGRDPGRDPGRDHGTELFAGDTVTRLRARWRELQADFVDDPRRAVREADELVDEVLRTITEHRRRLAGGWQDQTDTEHLRLAMREYRSFVDHLLPST